MRTGRRKYDAITFCLLTPNTLINCKKAEINLRVGCISSAAFYESKKNLPLSIQSVEVEVRFSKQ